MPKKKQAAKQAPWRIQLQRIGLFLLLLVAFSLLASIYLYLSAQITDTGVEIWRLEATREAAYYDIQSLQTELAEKSSVSLLKENADDLDFNRYVPQEVEYMVISGYYGNEPAIIGDPSQQAAAPDPMMKPAYTQSLWEWLLENLLRLSNQ